MLINLYNRISKIPTPISGLALAIISFGTLLERKFGLTSVFPIFYFTSLALLLPLLLRFALFPSSLINDLKHPVLGGVISTSAMCFMMLSFNSITWLIGFLLHILLLISFIFFRIKYFKEQGLLKIAVPSWFVPTVGLLVATITCKIQNLEFLMHYIFWICFGFYVFLMVLILNRFIFVGNLNETVLPNVGIMAAPSSLTLVAYLSLFKDPHLLIANFLFNASLLMVMVVYVAIIKILITQKPSFGFSAFTFPSVISATAIIAYNQIAQNSLLTFLSYIEVTFASCIIVFVLTYYIKNFIKSIRQKIKA